VQLLNWNDHPVTVTSGKKVIQYNFLKLFNSIFNPQAAAGTSGSWSSSVEGWTSTLGPIHYNALIEDLKH